MRDIIVIGGGLAGLYAAYAAAYNGAKVTLHEKSLIGFRDDCGELFTEVYTTVPEECIVNRIRYFEFRFKGETTRIDFGENTPFVMTDKNTHEKAMKDKCKMLGVKIIENSKYKYFKGLPVGSFIIDASGIYGINKYMGKIGTAIVYTTGRNRISELGFDTNLSTIEDNTALFEIRDDLKGYKWYFPKGRFVNIGEGVYDNRGIKNFMNLPSTNYATKGGGSLPMPDIVDYFNNIEEAGMVKGRPLIRVGNAAGLVNPVLGGGEHLAAISGLLAGCLVAHGKESNYTVALDDIIGDEMRFGCSIYQFMKKLSPDRIIELISKDMLFSPLLLSNSVNSVVREAMRKWITVPVTTNEDLKMFINK